MICTDLEPHDYFWIITFMLSCYVKLIHLSPLVVILNDALNTSEMQWLVSLNTLQRAYRKMLRDFRKLKRPAFCTQIKLFFPYNSYLCPWHTFSDASSSNHAIYFTRFLKQCHSHYIKRCFTDGYQHLAFHRWDKRKNKKNKKQKTQHLNLKKPPTQ